MKKLVDLRCYVSVNGEPYADTSIWKSLRYVECAEDNHEELIDTFEKAYDFIENGLVRNAYTDTTFWRKEPCIVIHYGELYRDDAKFTAKTFRKMKFKWVYEPVNKIYSIKELADELPADQFCEWLKDRNISLTISK